MPGSLGRLPSPTWGPLSHWPGSEAGVVRCRRQHALLNLPPPTGRGHSTCVTSPSSCCSQVVRLKKAACSPHTGCTATSSDISDCWFVSDNKFTKRCSYTPGPQAHSDIGPGIRTHGQSRSKRRQPSLRGKAAEPGDPGPSPQGPLECAVHRAVTELGFLWDSQACALEFRTPQEHPRGPRYVRRLRRLGQEGTRS